MSRLPDRTARVHVERDGRGGERELVAVAGRHAEHEDQLVRSKRRFDGRPTVRSPMQPRAKGTVRFAAPPRFDGRVERDQRLGEIAGIGRDAVRADAEHRMGAVVAADRRALRLLQADQETSRK